MGICESEVSNFSLKVLSLLVEHGEVDAVISIDWSAFGSWKNIEPRERIDGTEPSWRGCEVNILQVKSLVILKFNNW